MDALKEWATVVKALEQGNTNRDFEKRWNFRNCIKDLILNRKDFFYFQHGNIKKQNMLNQNFMTF